jgi:hypothetical protein
MQHLVGAAFWEGERAMSLGGGPCFTRRGVLHSRGRLQIPARNAEEVRSAAETQEDKTNPNLREPKLRSLKKTLTFLVCNWAFCDHLRRSCAQVFQEPSRRSTRLATVAPGEPSGEASGEASGDVAPPPNTSVAITKPCEPPGRPTAPTPLPPKGANPPTASLFVFPRSRLGRDVYMDTVEATFYDDRASSIEEGFDFADSKSIETDAEDGENLLWPPELLHRLRPE